MFNNDSADGCSAKYIESLENRLGRMENLLRLSGRRLIYMRHLRLTK